SKSYPARRLHSHFAKPVESSSCTRICVGAVAGDRLSVWRTPSCAALYGSRVFGSRGDDDVEDGGDVEDVVAEATTPATAPATASALSPIRKNAGLTVICAYCES